MRKAKKVMTRRQILDQRPGEGPRAFSRGVSFDIGDKTMIIISGAASTDAQGTIVHPGDAEAQTRRIFSLIEGRLAEAGGTLADIVKVLVFVKNIADYPLVNKVRLEVFPVAPPASSAIEARLIRDDFLVEIEAMAIVDRKAD